VRELVLDPCGADGLELGHTLVSQRAGDESRYYNQPAEERTRCVLAEGEEVCWPDGGFYLEAMDAHGGWIGSATDLLKFATALDGSRGQRLLQPESLELMTARPAAPVSQDSEAYYGFGWSIRRKKEETGWQQGNWWHTGSLPGSSALLVHTGRGMCWAALFNSRPPDDKIKAFAGELDALMWQAAGEVKEWPRHDLFAQRR
jgi:CubicO group peptidase (beta-lactamase class C family)